MKIFFIKILSFPNKNPKNPKNSISKIDSRNQSFLELKTLHSPNLSSIKNLVTWRDHRTVPTQKRDESKDKFPFLFFPFFGWLRQTHCRVFYVRFHRTFEAIQSGMQQHAYRIWLKCISLWNLQTLCVAAFYGFALFRNFWHRKSEESSSIPARRSRIKFYSHENAVRSRKTTKMAVNVFTPFIFVSWFMFHRPAPPSRRHPHVHTDASLVVRCWFWCEFGVKVGAVYVDWWTRNRWWVDGLLGSRFTNEKAGLPAANSFTR